MPSINEDWFQSNPLYQYSNSQAKRENKHVSLSPFIEFRITDRLSYRINSNGEIRNEKYNRVLGGRHNPQYVRLHTYKNSWGHINNYLLDNIISYEKKFSDKHDVSFTGTYGFQNNKETDSILNIEASSSDSLEIINFEDIDARTARNYYKFTNVFHTAKSYFAGRINYSFDNRYILAFTQRWDYISYNDQDSKMMKNYSISAAWNISNENILKSNNFINNLKYRISWGIYSRDKDNNYSFYLVNSRHFNTGIDLGILRNRIWGSFDFYTTRNFFTSEKLIIPGNLFTNKNSNESEIKGWGIGSILTTRIINSDFKWETSINWSTDKNEIVSLGIFGEKGKPVDDLANGWYIGHDINAVYDYKFIGVYQKGQENIAKQRHPDKYYYTAGDPAIADIDGNDTINEKDKTFQGSSVTPNWYGGINNIFKYKGFELSILIESVQGINRINYGIGVYTGRTNEIKENYWTPRHPSDDFPQPNSSGVYDYANAVRIQDASFIALRNVSMSYNLPESLIRKTPINQAVIYIKGNNLKYFTKFQSYTPEIDAGAYPV